MQTFVACALCGKDDAFVVYIVRGRSIVRCRGCDLVYLNPRPDAATIADLYGEQYFAGGGESIDAEDKPHHDYFAFYQELGEEDRYRAELRELSRFVSPGRILDISDVRPAGSLDWPRTLAGIRAASSCLRSLHQSPVRSGVLMW